MTKKQFINTILPLGFIFLIFVVMMYTITSLARENLDYISIVGGKNIEIMQLEFDIGTENEYFNTLLTELKEDNDLLRIKLIYAEKAELELQQYVLEFNYHDYQDPNLRMYQGDPDRERDL